MSKSEAQKLRKVESVTNMQTNLEDDLHKNLGKIPSETF
jgi:hypothetical protein